MGVDITISLPKKDAGVGLARKIIMDEAFKRFSTLDHNGVIACLDGDCVVQENYIEELITHYKSTSFDAIKNKQKW